jgi:hypothetical protein
MNTINATVTFVDQFSGATTTKTITVVDKAAFDNMKHNIGSTFSHFDKATHIRSEWKVIDVKQST